MLNFPQWKVLSILGVCVLGILFALPNLLSKEDADSLPWFLPSGQINLGLDLQGGQSLLLDVDVQETLDADLQDLRVQLPRVILESGARGRVSVVEDAIHVDLVDSADSEKVAAAIRNELSTTVATGLGGQPSLEVSNIEPDVLEVRFTEAAIIDRRNQVMSKTLEVIRKRVDPTGTKEVTIQRQGDDRILIEIPGGGFDTSILKEQAKLTFHHVDTSASQADLARGRAKAGYKVYTQEPELPGGQPYYYSLQVRPIIDGADLKDARATFDQQTNEPIVSFTFNQKAAKIFADYTLQNVNRPFAIVLDDKVVSAPVIRSPIVGGTGQISGGFSGEETRVLAIQLRSGALPATITTAEERTVGPDLGADSIAAGEIAGLLGLGAVVVFMFLSYGGFGLAANVSLFINLVLLAGALSLFGATLTLPGMAGIVLTIGMAVDANVLVFERIREEVRSGKGPMAAIENGYSQAMSTILDANITTLIAAVILFFSGSGPVRGFAVTLSVGIATSVFSAVIVTRMMLALWLRRRRPATLEI